MIAIGSLFTPTTRYAECPESGAVQDAIEAGVRTRVVTNVYQCLKSEVRDIISALDPRPATLLSAGGRNPDGTPANFVNWGAGYELTGADVSEFSPNFSRILPRYTATDPVGADGTPQAGVANGCLLGRPWEGGLRFVETPASGKMNDARVYLRDSFGWNRTRTVDLALICEKCDARTVADSLSLAPASLITNPYSGASITWGGSYGLVSLYGAPVSPSFYGITAKYRRNIAEAIAAPPAGVVLACTAGVCSIVWSGAKFEDMDSGLPADTTGLDVDNPSGYTIRMLCNGIVFSDFTPSVSTGDKILEWVITGGKAQLKWCGEIWREYEV